MHFMKFFIGVNMNEVFLIGKIITEIKFDFILNSKKKSIARFYIETLDGEKIKTVGYDNIADFCYKKLYIGKSVFVYGSYTSIRNRGEKNTNFKVILTNLANPLAKTQKKYYNIKVD